MNAHGTLDDATLVRVLRALADAKRFRMVQEIAAAGELSCGELAQLFTLSQPTISHHLKLLTESGVLAMRREAQHGFATVDRELVAEVAKVMAARLLEAARPRRPRKRRTRP
jgi:ArsR family transcriptional regulator, arsenate/arsenite/antimonite-responsive transcriptional repressor